MEVEFYCSSSGRNYVGEFIMGIPPKAVKKVYRQLELLKKYGVNFLTHSGTMKKLHGYDIYEMIIDFDKVCYRIFCVIRKAVCWLLHIFVKKSPHTPQREIDTAVKRARDLDYQLALAVN